MRFDAPRGIRLPLLGLTWFNLVSAVAGGIALASGAMAAFGLPAELLEGSVFRDYLVPGLLLAGVVGGTQLLPLIAYSARRELAWGLFAVAGFGMMIWIFIETGIIRGQSPLQLGYFASGLAQVVLVLLALGIWPHPFLARARPRCAARPQRPRATTRARIARSRLTGVMT